MRWFARLGWLVLVAVTAGCQTLAVLEQNPTVVSAAGDAGYDLVWDATVEVLEKYFDVAYENRYDGRLETKPQPAATLFEVWRPDSVGFDQRCEATLQTIRRRAFVLVEPGPAGGFLITVEVYKELEDLQRPAFAAYGGGSFIRSIEPIRERVVSSAVQPSAGWISLGRDSALEAKIIAELHERIDRHLPVEY